MAVVIGEVQSMVSFGGHIDVMTPQPIVEEDLRAITLVTSDQVQIRDNVSFINQFSGATVAPAALMKAHALMARETIKETTETVLLPCQKVFETFFLREKQRTSADCVNCHDGDDLHLCMCNRELHSFHGWNEGLRTSINAATFFQESEALDNLTEPTEVSLVTSLATTKVVREMTTGRKVYALSAENFEVVKTIFPVHVTVVHAETGQTVVDQMFSVPKYVDLYYLPSSKGQRISAQCQ